MEKEKHEELDTKLKSLPSVKLSDAYKKEMHQNLMEQVVLHENMSMKQRLKRRFFLSLGSLLLVGILLFILYINMNGGMKVFGQTGYEDVIQHHVGVENLDDFYSLLEDIESRRSSEINVINYGIEGQEWSHLLKYNGLNIHVELSVDGEFIEEYVCAAISKKEENKNEYALNQCQKQGSADLFDITILRTSTILKHGYQEDEN